MEHNILKDKKDLMKAVNVRVIDEFTEELSNESDKSEENINSFRESNH